MAYGHTVVERLDNYGFKCLCHNREQLDYLIACGAQPSQLVMPGEPSDKVVRNLLRIGGNE